MWRLWIKGKLRNGICLSILLLLSFSTVAICGERQILVLHSYDPEYIYTRIFNDTLERELQEKDYSIDLFMSFLMQRGLILVAIMISSRNTSNPNMRIKI